MFFQVNFFIKFSFCQRLDTTVRDAAKRNIAKIACGCTLTNKQISAVRTDRYI